MKRIIRQYTVRFLTPAFLGNVEQSGQWRSPPFKALLRQWWRIAIAAEKNFDQNSIRECEAKLFGAAADGNESGKSRVRIRLSGWASGTLEHAPKIGKIRVGQGQPDAALYSAFGPVVNTQRQGPRLKAGAAIQAGEEAAFHIAFPDCASLNKAIALMHSFGTAGGRSRNGWGSFELKGEVPKLPLPLRDWREAMELSWPHCIGMDREAGPLIWRTAPQKRWEDVMRLLAQARSDIRKAVPEPLALAYPATKRTFQGWGKHERVPNSLRFKVRAQDSQFVGVVFHMPCRPAQALWDKLPVHIRRSFPDNFAAAHRWLDGKTELFTRSEF